MKSPPNPRLKAATEIVRNLRAEKFQAYLVGGCVRDMLLGREPKDWDVDVTRLQCRNHAPNLAVTVCIVLPGHEEKRDYHVKDRVISVAVNPVYSVRTFLSNNWQWIIGSLGGLGAIAAFLRKWLIALWGRLGGGRGRKVEAEAAHRDAA